MRNVIIEKVGTRFQEYNMIIHFGTNLEFIIEIKMFKEDDYMKKKILMMVLAMTMLAGCGAKEATPTDAGVADTTVAEEVVVDEQDNQEVVQEEVASDTEQVTEEPAVEESSLPENPTEEDFSLPYLYNILSHSRENESTVDVKDENGSTLYSATKIPDALALIYHDKSEVSFDKSFEYLDVNGEKWLQMTVHIPDGATDFWGCPLSELDDNFNPELVLTYSPDFFKVMYDGVVYSASQEYIDLKKQYSPYAKDYDYDGGTCLNRAYDDAGNILY